MGSFIKTSILRADLFAAQPSNRVRGEPVFETLFGGILSILLMGSFIGVFFQSILNVLNKVEITAH